MRTQGFGHRSVWAGLLLLGLPACSYVTQEEGQRMQQQITQLQMLSQQSSQQLAEKLQRQSEELNRLLDEARRLTSSLADSAQKTSQLTADQLVLQGKIEELQRSVDALQKQFNDYRATSDTKLEQLGNTVATVKNPPLPETPDALFAEAQRKLEARQYNDARRMYDAFINRFPTDARAAKAQVAIGDSYFQEAKYANAIIAFRKVIDQHPKSEEVESAMFKAGQALFLIKRCSEAKIYFQELLRVYPKTRLKNDANEQIKEIGRQSKNRASCES